MTSAPYVVRCGGRRRAGGKSCLFFPYKDRYHGVRHVTVDGGGDSSDVADAVDVVNVTYIGFSPVH